MARAAREARMRLARPSVTDYICVMLARMNILLSALVLSLGLSSACNKPAAPATGEAATKPKVEGSPTPYAVGQKTHCAVTGEEFVVAATTVQVEHEGKHYAFCCPDCAPSFQKNPGKYAKKN